MWFAVLPDSEAGLAAARVLRPRASRTIDHASGRPWLVGSWPDERVTLAGAGTGTGAGATAGAARVAVIGRCPVTAAELAARLRQVRDVVDTERAVAGLAGSFHVVTSAGGRVRVRGSASGACGVFYTRFDGVTVAADRADRLAEAVGASPDERMLALHLLSSPPPHPLDDRSPWRGVHRVPSGDCLLIEADGRARTRRWWTPPDPVLSAAEGAREVRRALVAAVESCTAGGGTVSADLSGGMDSTGLCFLAARIGAAKLVTLRWEGADPGDDGRRAAQAAAALPDARHVRPGRSGTPLLFSDPAEVVDVLHPGAGYGMSHPSHGVSHLSHGMSHPSHAMSRSADVTGHPPHGLGHPLHDTNRPADEPGAWVRDAARFAKLSALMTVRGSRLHMSGGGGGELFTAPAPHLHDLLRSRPLAALAAVRRKRAGRRLPLLPVLGGLADRSNFPQWLTAWADSLVRPAAFPAGNVPSMTWGPDLRMPSWATADAVLAVRGLLREAAAAAPEPLHAQRGQHAALASVRAGGRSVRQIGQVTSARGLEYAAPYLDDGVVEAALSVRVDERGAPGRYKPVLAAALRGIVPDPVLGRSAGGEFSADLYAGLRHNRGRLVALFEDSLLARAGLVDAAALRASVLGLHPVPEPLRPLDATLGCELWLRSLPDRAALMP
ncbi:asparagine synthase-related protein [Streptomyces roseifaciens]|uniref:asparagine synthase-related protein n=1 Tax=Streptomyces roseifaciens TaxID=1488406 RepID=UPI000717E85B|nr:asparagine synthase-related protein [Streptomyces roseifaciens]